MSWPGEIPAKTIPMDSILLLEQSLNGLQLGMMLFLLASGLTLTFGIMGIINLAHGVTYMLGAYIAATVMAATSSFLLAVLAGDGFCRHFGTHDGVYHFEAPL
jgi:Branched-chain amino acid ABC-type transport system, permease components